MIKVQRRTLKDFLKACCSRPLKKQANKKTNKNKKSLAPWKQNMKT